MSPVSRSLAILGSTGSIGRSALELLDLHPDAFRVCALTAARRVEELPADSSPISERHSCLIADLDTARRPGDWFRERASRGSCHTGDPRRRDPREERGDRGGGIDITLRFCRSASGPRRAVGYSWPSRHAHSFPRKHWPGRPTSDHGRGRSGSG